MATCGMAFGSRLLLFTGTIGTMPGPNAVPVTSTKNGAAGVANRMVTTAPCRMLPTVVPLHVVVNGATAGTGVQKKLSSTPLVVGMKICGVLPGTVFAGPVPESVKVIGPVAPVCVAEPVTLPVTTQRSPTRVAHATAA